MSTKLVILLVATLVCVTALVGIRMLDDDSSAPDAGCLPTCPEP